MFLSEIIEDLYIDEFHNKNDSSLIVNVSEYGGNYYLIKGLKQVLEFLRDGTWDSKIRIVKLKRDLTNLEDYKKVLNKPHAKTDKSFNKKNKFI